MLPERKPTLADKIREKGKLEIVIAEAIEEDVKPRAKVLKKVGKKIKIKK